jgi:hypothetical protein
MMFPLLGQKNKDIVAVNRMGTKPHLSSQHPHLTLHFHKKRKKGREGCLLNWQECRVKAK